MSGALRALRDLWTPSAKPLLAPAHSGIVFRTTRGPRDRPLPLKMDVYPASGGEGSSCLLVHGGSFVLGDRAMKPCRVLASRLVEQGITVASIDYRLVQQRGVFPRPVRDVKGAMRFWFDNAARYGANPERITLVGLSAGGALALIAAAMPDDDPRMQVKGGRTLATPRVARVASVYGVTDFPSFRYGLTPLLRRLVTGSEDPAVWKSWSPVEVASFEMPLLVIHGDADTVVPVEQAHAIDRARREMGRPVETHIYSGAPHAFFASAECEATARGAQDLGRFILA